MIESALAALILGGALSWKRVRPPAVKPPPPALPPTLPPIKPAEYVYSPFDTERGAHRTTQAAVRAFIDRGVDPGPLFRMAGVMWPCLSSLNRLTFVTGKPGTGKTLMEKLSLQSLGNVMGELPALAASGRYPGNGQMRWFVTDPTDAYLPFLYQVVPQDVEILRISPNDAEGVRWDIARDVHNEAMILCLVKGLFPDALVKQSTDRFWYDQARELVADIIRVFHDRNSDWEFADLIRAVKYSQFLAPILAQSHRTRGKLKRELTGKQGISIISSASAVTNQMATAAALWDKTERKVSMREFLDRRAVMHLSYPPNMVEAMSGIANAMIYMLMMHGFERNDPFKHTIYFLDEAKTLGGITGLEDLSARGRGSGFGAYISAQGTPGLISSWGENRVRELLDVLATWTTFSCGYETAEAFCRLVGKVEGVQMSYGYSNTSGFGSSNSTSHSPQGTTFTSSTNYSSSTTYSRNFQIAVRDTVLPSEITNLRANTAQFDELTGFCFNSDLGAFRWSADFKKYFAELEPPPFEKMPVRPDDAQILHPFRREDILRLRLDLTPEMDEAIRETWGNP